MGKERVRPLDLVWAQRGCSGGYIATSSVGLPEWVYGFLSCLSKLDKLARAEDAAASYAVTFLVLSNVENYD